MKVVESKIARMLACSAEEADALAAEGKRVPTRAVGVRVTLDCGTVAFWSFKWRTVSVSYPGHVACDRLGQPVWDEGGVVHKCDNGRKNKPLGVPDFVRQYGVQFAGMVLGAIHECEKAR
jgi:hypothetical protein